LHGNHKGGICSASGNRLRGSTSDLIRSSSEASAWGEPCGGCLRPWLAVRPARQQHLVHLRDCTQCTVPVYKALCTYSVRNQCSPNCCLACCSSKCSPFWFQMAVRVIGGNKMLASTTFTAPQ
jgi:hypothetical protein